MRIRNLLLVTHEHRHGVDNYVAWIEFDEEPTVESISALFNLDYAPYCGETLDWDVYDPHEISVYKKKEDA